MLDAARVKAVVDVRIAPGSRKHPHFGRTELAATLDAAGIAYEWMRELGGWRRPTPDSRNVALRSPAFRGYADHMATDEFRSALGRLIERANETRTAVMCAESLWWRCHRAILADRLVAVGCVVTHIVPAGRGQIRLEGHRLTRVARVSGGEVVYDVIEPAS